MSDLVWHKKSQKVPTGVGLTVMAILIVLSCSVGDSIAKKKKKEGKLQKANGGIKK